MAGAMLMQEFSNLCGIEKKSMFPEKNILIKELQILQLHECLLIYDMSMDKKSVMDKITNLTGMYTVKEAEYILKTWIIDLESEKKASENRMKQDAEKENYDIRFLATDVCRFMGFQIDRRKTSVAEFAGYVASYKKQIERDRKKEVDRHRKH